MNKPEEGPQAFREIADRQRPAPVGRTRVPARSYQDAVEESDPGLVGADVPTKDSKQEDTVMDLSVWGTAAGYLTGDPALLAARGHTDEEIQNIQIEIAKRRGE